MRYGAGFAILASGHPAAPSWRLTAVTWVIFGVCGILGLSVLVWDARRRQTERQAHHRQWAWLAGWALILTFCAGLTWWMDYRSGSAGLSLTVSSLSSIVPTLFAVWYTQASAKGTVMPGGPAAPTATGGEGSDQSVSAEQAADHSTPTPKVIPMPSRLDEGADIDLAPLADARQAVQILRNQVGVLRARVLSAVVAHDPAQDWRMLLAEPRCRLNSVVVLLDQLGQARSGWRHTGAWSFAFADTVAAARRAAADLGEAIDERTEGRSARINLSNAVTRLDHVVGQLAGLVDNAVPNP